MRVCRSLLLLLFASTLARAAALDRITSAIDSSQRVELARSVHPKAQPQFDQGAVDPQMKLGYVTLLTSPSPSQQRALDKLLADQQNPASPLYHQWLTPEQYADRFGLSQKDVAKITAWLKAQGFKMVSVARGRNWIVVSGTVAVFESAFQTQIHRFSVNGESHFANATPLRIPAALSGVVTDVRGLHNFLMKPLGVRRPSGLHPLYYDSTVSTVLAPGDIATIYDVSPLYNASPAIDGTGQKLAVVGQTDIYPADIDDFRNGFNLPNPNPLATNCTNNSTTGLITACNTPNFQYILIPGSTDPGAASKCGDVSEADLDIEWSGATARNAQIIFVNSPVVFDSTCTKQTNTNPGVDPGSLYYAIDNQVAPVISMSYGICEAQAANDEAELQKANSLGITVINSTGDVGAAGCDYNPPGTNPVQPFSPAVNGQAVSYPASSPEVTGVSGTEISLTNLTAPSQYWSTTNGANDGTALQYVPEIAWNDDAEIALLCQQHATNLFCKQGGTTAVQGWVPLGTSATAQQVQQDIWISSGGGGVSNCFGETAQGVCTSGFPKPSWQSTLSLPGVPAQLATYRLVPDVSLMSSPDFPGYIICTPLSELGGTGSTSSCASGIANAVDVNSSIIGGTSAAAPVFAGIVTLLNQYLTPSSPGLGNINPKLYSLAATPANNAFHAVNSGNNFVYCQSGTPTNQTTLTSIQCPSTGVLGFDSANFDTTTHYNLVTGLGSVDANNFAIAWAASRSTSMISVVASPTTAAVNQSVTMTATVSPTTALGKVTFSNSNNGSSPTTLGTANVSSGVATFTTTSLPVGTDNISASYSGDGYNAAAMTAAPAIVTVAAPTSTFTFASTGASSHTVLAGQQTLTYTFTATPTSPTTFADNVTLSCSAFAPTDPTLTASSCAFSPSTIMAGSGATPVSLTITTAGPNTGMGTAIQHRADRRLPLLPLALPIAGVVVVGLAGRKVPKRLALAGLCASLVLLGIIVACGGGGGGGGGSSPIVTVSPASASVQLGGTQQFTASVSNSTSPAVTWSLSGAGAVGSIDANGLYTAPSTGTTPANFSVVATLQSDPTKTGSSAVTIKAVGVSVSPGTASLYPNNTGWPSQTQFFSATVSSASNTAVSWSVPAGGGSIDASGNYTAPTIAAGLPSSVTVTATSQVDSSKTGTGTVTLKPTTVPGSYTVTVTATELGASLQTATASLVVQ